MHFGEPPPEDGPLPTCPDAGSTSSETAGVKRVTWVTWVGESVSPGLDILVCQWGYTRFKPKKESFKIGRMIRIHDNPLEWGGSLVSEAFWSENWESR